MDSIENKYNAIMEELSINNSNIISTITENHLSFQQKLTDLMSYVDKTVSDTKRLVSEQEDRINELSQKLDTNKFEESNYNKVSVLKNQDKQIRELNIKVEELESKNKHLQNKVDELDNGKGKKTRSKTTASGTTKRGRKPRSKANSVAEPEPEPEPKRT